MKVSPLPSKERILQVLDYNPITGIFTWKTRPPKVGRGGMRRKGVAGTLFKCAKSQLEYIRIAIDHKSYLAHRIALFLETDLQPSQVDHKNGNTLDNRAINLRPADNTLNTRNAAMRKDNNTGVIGINWDKINQRWLAIYGSVTFRKLHKTKKSFSDFFEAVCQRKSWENQFGMTEAKKHRGS